MKKLFVFLLVLSFSYPAMSADYFVSESRFRFAAPENGFDGIKNMVWLPTRPHFNDGNIIGSFHGGIDSGVGCPVVANCSTENPYNCFGKNPWFLDSQLTGMSSATVHTPACPGTVQMGNSFIATSNKGIGYYTSTGPRSSGNPTFHVPHPTFNGSSIFSNFDVFRNSTDMLPFSASCSGSNCGDRVRMRVWSRQAVENSVIGNRSQNQQKMGFILKNINDKSPKLGKFGEIEYLPWTHCKGINCSDVITSAADPNQGSRPYVGGKIAGGGQTSYLYSVGGQSNPVWQSFGASGTSNTFGDTWFHYEISWNHFVSTLRHITTRLGKDGTKDYEVASIYGNNWNIRNSWQLKSVRVGQEVYNANWRTEKSSIGGRLIWFQVDAIVK